LSRSLTQNTEFAAKALRYPAISSNAIFSRSGSVGLTKYLCIRGESAILSAMAISAFTDDSSLMRSISSSWDSSWPAFSLTICRMESINAPLPKTTITIKSRREKSINFSFIDVWCFFSTGKFAIIVTSIY